MPRYPQVSGQEVVKALGKVGFRFVSQKGSQVKLRKGVINVRTVIVPTHRTIRKGTLRNILTLAHLDMTEFRTLLKK